MTKLNKYSSRLTEEQSQVGSKAMLYARIEIFVWLNPDFLLRVREVLQYLHLLLHLLPAQNLCLIFYSSEILLDPN